MKNGAIVLVSLLCLAGIAAYPASPEDSRDATVTIQAEGRGSPWLNLRDGFDLPVQYAAGQRAPAGARPTALVAADFDADGMPDLVTGYADGTAGLLVLRRGNPAAIFPHLSAETSAPFFPLAVVVETPTPPDFLVAGDFDNDGHPDIVTASLFRTSLFLHCGDGTGGLKQARKMDLSAEVTLLTAGDVNRVDRLFELVVGTDSPDGPELLVFESPRGAWNAEPEIFSLPSPATAATLGDHDRDTRADIAIVAGSELVLIRGRDRKLAEGAKRMASVPEATVQRSTLRFKAGSIAFGDFTGRGIRELAVLSDGGTLELIEGATAKPIVDVETGVQGGKLVATNATTTPGDDLIVIEREARKLHVYAGGPSRDDSDAGAPEPAFARPEMRTTLDLDAEPMGVLPMRLNQDALADLVVVRNATGPAVAVTPSAPTSIYTVINTNDSGPGSLRRAINDANFYAGADAIHFNIPGSGAHSIHALSDLPEITDPVTIDGTTQAGYAGTPLIEIHGTVGESGRRGLVISGGNSTVRGLTINRFSSHGVIFMTSGNNRIESCYVGTTPGGGTALPNQTGILMTGSHGNIIGGRLHGQGNLASGNTAAGIDCGDSLSTAGSSDIPKAIPDVGVVSSTLVSTATTVIEDLGVRLDITHPRVSDLDIYLHAPDTTWIPLSTGNGDDGADFFGTEFDDEAGISVTEGQAPFFRTYRPEIPLTSFDGLPMAGTWTLEVRDTVAANTGTINSWELVYKYNTTTGNEIEGNFVGTDASGTVSLANGGGIDLSCDYSFLGAAAAGARNLVSGNAFGGIFLGGGGNVVQGNLIGTDVSGTSAVGSGSPAIQIYGGGNLVGGAALGAGNVLAFDLGCGILLNTANGTVVQGNLVGTDVTGTVGLGGPGTGICNRGGAVNTIGGTTAETRNVIADLGDGLLFSDALWLGPVPYSPRGNAVIGNYIGTDVGGSGRLGHQRHGIALESGYDNAIENGNVICANAESGVWIGPEAWENRVIENRIGIDLGGAADPGNGHGVIVEGKYNVIESNVISGNEGHGILMNTPDVPAIDTIVNTDLPQTVPDPGGIGAFLEFFGDARVIDVDVQIDVDHTWDSDLTFYLVSPDLTQVELTSSNGGDGDGYDGTIFDDEATRSITEGTAPFSGSYRPEQPLAAFDGTPAQGWWWLWVYDLVAGDVGILRDASLTLTTVANQGNEIRANTIGLDEAALVAVPNLGAGIHVEGTGNGIENNYLAGNFGPGLEIIGQSAVGNVLAANTIGFPDFTFPDEGIGNGGDGVIIDAGPFGAPVGNRIGVEGDGNAIYYNSGNGVRVAAGSSTSIRENNITQNGGLGIDLGPLGVTHNDPFDADGGPNGLQNFPVITSVAVGPTETVVEGILESTPDQVFIIDLHSWGTDPSGYGEGSWIASQAVTTAPTGEAPFAFVVPGTEMYLTATATGPDGSTSEFSGAMSNVGAASETSDMTARRLPGTEMEVSFDIACGATDHAIYHGVSPIFGSLFFSDVACFVGMSGTAVFDPGDPGPGEFFYFVVVGQNYVHEGSYGQDSYGVERPEATGFGACDRPQEIPVACP